MVLVNENELYIFKELLKKRLGVQCLTPQKLHILPRFIVKKRENASKQNMTAMGDQGERKLLASVLEMEALSDPPPGYHMSDIDISSYCPENDYQTDAIFLGKDYAIVFEVKNYARIEDAIKEGKRQLPERVNAVKNISGGKILVEGALVVPFIDKPACPPVSSFHILFKEDLDPYSLSKWISSISSSVDLGSSVTDTKKEDALTKLLMRTLWPKGYSITTEEYVYQQFQRISLQRGNRYQLCDHPTFNSIEFTDSQCKAAKSMQNRNSVLIGAYGTGKLVTVVRALQHRVKKAIKEGSQMRVIFISAQEFLKDCRYKRLHYSRFLETAKQWIKEALVGEEYLINHYTDDLSNFLYDTSSHKIIIQLCMLSSQLLKTWCNIQNMAQYLRSVHQKHSDVHDSSESPCNQQVPERPDVIILDETSALSEANMKNLFKCLIDADQIQGGQQGSKSQVVWITSSFDFAEVHKKYPDLRKLNFQTISLGTDTVRNTLEVVALSEGVQSQLIPERYPSCPMTAGKIHEGIPVMYYSKKDDNLRVKEIVKITGKWLCVPRHQLLIIDCENNRTLFDALTINSVAVCQYPHYRGQDDIFLFLRAGDDPVEAIVAGGEWAVIVLHCKRQTFFSRTSICTVTKRIFSRASAAVYLFSDESIDLKASLVELQVDKEESSQQSVELSDSVVVRKQSDVQTASYEEHTGDSSRLHLLQLVADIQASQNIKSLKSDVQVYFQDGFYVINVADLMVDVNEMERRQFKAVWTVDKSGSLYPVHLVSNSTSVSVLKEAQKYFLERYYVKLPLISRFKIPSDISCKPAELAHLKLLLDVFRLPVFPSITSTGAANMSCFTAFAGFTETEAWAKTISNSKYKL